MSDLFFLSLCLGAGVAIGLVYFRLVRVSSDLMLGVGRGGLWQGLALSAARLLVLGAVLTFAAFQGAGPLLALSLGWLIGRFAVLRWAS
ncbi:hypothetical protein [Roseibaca sp. Y0-43]|uniref:hypothetical protein n=1 Tax=Roseibaca sp. Y0-43 TaxID=2816854 RepID=UPI001D0CD45F|nr:hypothetical protein [Roseibaca sp. Y0-43]MCC1482692.1 hypothetical protein [Roseibaca sp. Y0-43]